MYDKIKLLIERATMGGVTPQQVVQYLNNVKEQIYTNTGNCQYTGYLNTLKVVISSKGVFIDGSLPRYHKGNNIYPLDRHTTQEAFERLQGDLHLNLNEAKIIGCEFGNTFVMKHPIPLYLERLEAHPRLERICYTPSTLYYTHVGIQKPKELYFYDKAKERKTNREPIPPLLSSANLLRYEIRYNNNFSKQTGIANITPATLVSRGFYKQMIETYKKQYYSITKTPQIKTEVMTEIKTQKDAFEVFFARLINHSGGREQINEFVAELKRAKVFSDRSQYSHLKRKLEEVSSKAKVTETNELIKELNDQILNVGIYD